ncbi:hypothetical protein FB550_101779 [Neobacillus bataviensis]|uniref:Lipoprotein n=1 Tax=Neobacillus bataviensis TaxID=220685 RepID=A0A561DZG4_9BACI|nr:hypothetical protein FB550_101779 [Neobacillus bataviensis]
MIKTFALIVALLFGSTLAACNRNDNTIRQQLNDTATRQQIKDSTPTNLEKNSTSVSMGKGTSHAQKLTYSEKVYNLFPYTVPYGYTSIPQDGVRLLDNGTAEVSVYNTSMITPTEVQLQQLKKMTEHELKHKLDNGTVTHHPWTLYVDNGIIEREHLAVMVVTYKVIK